MVQNPAQRLREAGFRCVYTGSSGLDAFWRIPERHEFHLLTDAGLVDLGRLFDDLQFSVTPLDDACLIRGEQRWIFYCSAENWPDNGALLPLLQFHYDDENRVWLDPQGVFDSVQQRCCRLSTVSCGQPGQLLAELTRVVSRYDIAVSEPLLQSARDDGPLAAGWLRGVLESVLSGKNAAAGLELLDDAGVIDAHWPELAQLKRIRQDKEFHPEGDVWQHTLEALRQRRNGGLRLGLGLLLHDAGKAVAPVTRERPFADHSRHGVPVAARFLRRLGYDEPLVRDILFLVRNHMLPAALDRLPVHRTRTLMESPLFPVLLELSRADLAATWGDMELYHRAQRAYKKFCRNRRNPYRSDDGRLQSKQG